MSCIRSGFNGSEKKRANEIIDAESLSAGRPQEEIKEETERGKTGGAGAEVFAVCAEVFPD